MTADVPVPQPPPPPPPPPINSRAEFSAALHWALQASVAQRARRIVWVDPDFAEWPLDDPAWHGTLAAWLRLPQRRLVLLASNFADMPRRHPRFTAWRKLWSHAIEPWSPDDGAVDSLPTLALDDAAVCVQLMDAQKWRGRASLDPQISRPWCDRIDAVLQRSSPAFPASTLGL